MFLRLLSSSNYLTASQILLCPSVFPENQVFSWKMYYYAMDVHVISLSRCWNLDNWFTKETTKRVFSLIFYFSFHCNSNSGIYYNDSISEELKYANWAHCTISSRQDVKIIFHNRKIVNNNRIDMCILWNGINLINDDILKTKLEVDTLYPWQLLWWNKLVHE